MSFTILDAITQAREIVQDVDQPYRHQEAKLLGYLNDALADVRRLRPDLFIGRLLDDYILYDSSNYGDPFPIDYTYFTAVVDYIASMIGLGDDEYAQDGRAAALHARFITRLTGKFA